MNLMVCSVMENMRKNNYALISLPPKVHTKADIPLVETTAGVAVVGKAHLVEIGLLIGIDQAEVVPATEEELLVLETKPHPPCNVETIEVVAQFGVVIIEKGVFQFLGSVSLQLPLKHFLVHSQSALDRRSRIENDIGTAGNLELILPIDKEFQLVIRSAGTRLGMGGESTIASPFGLPLRKGIVDTYAGAEPFDIGSIVNETYLQSVQDGGINQRILCIACIGRVETQNGLCKTDLETEALRQILRPSDTSD